MKLKSREIKFRAWGGKCMFYGVGIDCSYSLPRRIKGGGIDPLHLVTFSSAKLMQYTGLKDKNGKEIYDGDLILAHTDYESENDKYMWNKKNPCIVRWIEKNAGFFPFSLNNRWRCDLKDVEIIGNIKENPELLK